MPAIRLPFDLPDRLAAKRDPALIAADQRHFATITATLDRTVADLRARLDDANRSRNEERGEAVERDMEVRRLSSRLATLSRYRLDLCLGRMVGDPDAEPVYIGRLGLTDPEGHRLLVDWRSPAAEPFFAATLANPMGLTTRRRYRWTGQRITDYWDEAFTFDGAGSTAALDDESAFIASLGTSRSPRMRDVLGTIQADQDAIIRAGSRGALVVEGGPGTGKTVVALHRSAYLLYSDPRLARHHGGVLFVGPSPAYLSYVADVLPSLGEDGVQLCTLRSLVPEGADAVAEPDAHVASLKSSARLVAAIDEAVRYHEKPPARPVTVETQWGDLHLEPQDWADAFLAAEPGASHNDARDQIWEELMQIVHARLGEEVPPHLLRRALQQSDELRSAFSRAWPVLDPAGVVADLWSAPGYLHRCAPWLGPDDILALQRQDARAWTVSDLPLLDAARARIGDPDGSRRRRRQAEQLFARREEMSRVIDHLMQSTEFDDGEGTMSMLRQQSMQDALIDDSGVEAADPDLLAGPFAHIVVDEAQELTDAEWQMLLARCPSRSFTVVGDRAQARRGFAETWAERLERVGLGDATIASLTINYRTPEEVMAAAEPVIRSVLPDANVPTSIRRSGIPVRHAPRAQLGPILEAWLAENDDGIACVIGDPRFPAAERVASLTPELAKGLEFDLVVLVDPEAFGPGVEGAVDRYVAMTRATQQLVIVTS
ncbi:MAG TPA: RNA polymerase recycling motor ATPase HelR [Pseudolysinimonas sp.]|nr:RNA polymerase recycling motor ATPase HelR [Pseudolysinimonas sp.]